MNTQSNMYKMWLQYREMPNKINKETYGEIAVIGNSPIQESIKEELTRAFEQMYQWTPVFTENLNAQIVIAINDKLNDLLSKNHKDQVEYLLDEGYIIASENNQVIITGKSSVALLYGVFHFLKDLQIGKDIHTLNITNQPKNSLRMINQWDNLDGTIERGYSGNSIFYENGKIVKDKSRIKDYARYLASVGINAIAINNVNVWEEETFFITKKYLPEIKEIAQIFTSYGLKTYISINFASPIAIGGLHTADPMNEQVKEWWKKCVKEIYDYIPNFGGFLVKADSEHRPGPFTYNRDHKDGANMLAEALAPFGGKVIWRCFVYNCVQDWRDRSTDRARAAYDHFKPLDGLFHENVILQIKNGPMDFQVREPVSPLLGAMHQTNQMVEFQIAQEYTGQQIDLCYLIPQWKDVLSFDTYVKGEGSTIEKIVAGQIHPYRYSGIAAVSNIGNDENWTGNTLAQANLYGYGRLIWDPSLEAEEIACEWIALTFDSSKEIKNTVSSMLMDSLSIYENYTAPLGVGWMVTPHYHYGPNIDGYEYSRWGTYHFADRNGIGVDRTQATGTSYTSQYNEPNASIYEQLDTCPDELILFFHHVPYDYVLHSGKTIIQHIYDTHFLGYKQVEQLIKKWAMLENVIDVDTFRNVEERLQLQRANAKEWRDQINTYFYRKSGIPDQQKRTIY